MGDSVYRVTEVIGTSSESWEAAAANAVATAAASVRDLRVAEVLRQDLTMMVVEHPALAATLKASFETTWAAGIPFAEAHERFAKAAA